MEDDNPGPAKAAKFETFGAAQQGLDSINNDFKEQLDQKDKAMQASEHMLFSGYNSLPDRWSEMPDVLRYDATALTQALAGSRLYIFRREDIPEETLQKALPILLAKHRESAVKLCGRRVLTWDEVNPTRAEWRTSEYLYVEAIKRNLVRITDFSKDIGSISEHLYVKGLEHGLVVIDDLSKDLGPFSLEGIARAIKVEGISWDRVPHGLKNSHDFCRFVLDPSEGSHLIAHSLAIFQRHPRLAQDRQVWEKILDKPGPWWTNVEALFSEGFYPSDHNLFEEGIRKIDYPLGEIDQIVFADITQRLIESDPDKYIFDASTQFIQAHQEFFIAQFARLQMSETYFPDFDFIEPDLYSIEHLAQVEIPPAMWNVDAFVETWFEVGLPIISHQPIHQEWNADPDKLLLVAEKCARLEWKLQVFLNAPQELRGDVDFMTQAMRFDPSLLLSTSQALGEVDFALAIWACTDSRFVRGCREEVQRMFEWNFPDLRVNEAVMEGWYRRANQELAHHNVFVNPFLCQLLLTKGGDGGGSDCALSMLDQGGSGQPQPLLTKILEYVGSPRGDHLRNLRNALELRAVLVERGVY